MRQGFVTTYTQDAREEQHTSADDEVDEPAGNDDRLDAVVQAMEELEAAIVIALTLLEQPLENGR